MLTVSGLSGGYGDSQVLFDLDLSVEAGSVLALVGRNGAGKSTTFKTIAGQLRGWSGSIQLDGHDLSGLPPHVIARRGIGYVPEDRQVFAELTVADNIAIAEKPPAAGADRRWSSKNIYDVFPALKLLKDRPAGRLSGGEQQMLTIARTLVGNPAVLLLDEPSEGLAPKIVTAIAELVEQIAGTGTTVIMAEQNLAFCMRTASAVAIMERGCIVYRDKMSTLRNDERIRRQYLAI